MRKEKAEMVGDGCGLARRFSAMGPAAMLSLPVKPKDERFRERRRLGVFVCPSNGSQFKEKGEQKMRMRVSMGALAALGLCLSIGVGLAGESDLRAEVDSLRREIEAMRAKNAAATAQPTSSTVDKALTSGKYGPNAAVTTKTGKLTMSGLFQIWFYTIQNDHSGPFGGDPAASDGNTLGGTEDQFECNDNDSFRIRRTELKFTMDLNENIMAVVMIDPAREAGTWAGMNSNLGTRYGRAQDPGGIRANMQTGAGNANRMLQDAYITFHSFVPHHDFTVGQYKPPFGDEGIRSSAGLDFAERSMIGQIGDARDLGLSFHGEWLDKRLEYWGGVFNGAGNFHGSAGQHQNRNDDNDFKDLLGRILVRPVYKNETWGTLELGYSVQWGRHGEAGDPGVGGAVSGLNLRRTNALRHAAWGSYFPGGPVKGFWVRGEWMNFHDRNIPGAIDDIVNDALQTAPQPFTRQGFYVSTGYDIGKSVWKDSVPKWFKPTEFAFRYEQFQNINIGGLVNPDHTDVFASKIYTAGINYYIKGHNAKIQMNYNWVDEPDKGHKNNRGFREVQNDNFLMNFQVSF
jgi:hypothetical protein